ncbi:hypothetical protein ONA91_35950 [Micromonospora sp. DR5-3]|uniref:hypothetical protein n=1 Tax=unclassified Micromonospora TaxID=2617518 RepID=UPI0011D50816|nr:MULTISPECIES: hypothetical protein [unclassified Micromonospora]MCW3819844.1 hypothetical protein [Micromonospora sp. DR5-3]TYC19927.1 hypothetical protein FXF52_34150 [Micromonospora sp. MP36]
MSPRPVFIASLLLSGAAALWVAWAIGTLFGLPQFVRIYMNDHQGDGHPAVVIVSYVLLAALTAVIGLVFLLLAVLDARGARVARVFTWILAVPAVLVALWSLLSGGSADTPWWGMLTRAIGGLTLPMVAAAMVLLCLPGARAHFRKRP